MAELQFPEDVLYSKSHEWIRLQGDGCLTMGVTDYAQDQLGDVVYLELPQVGEEVRDPSAPIGTIESVKAVEDLYCPVAGEVVEVNLEVLDHPEWVNEDPYHQGWLVKIRARNPEDVQALMTAAQYRQLVAAQGR